MNIKYRNWAENKYEVDCLIMNYDIFKSEFSVYKFNE